MSSATPPGMSPRDLESFLHENIPLSRAMGLHVAETGARLVLEAPLAANVNHQRQESGYVKKDEADSKHI